MRAYDFRETCIKSENEIAIIKENEVTIDAIDSPEMNEEFTEEVIIDIESPQVEPKHSCRLCQNLFVNSQQLALHVINCKQASSESIVQNSKRKFECHVCGKKFESLWKTRRHFLVHKDIIDPAELPKISHKEYKYECQECGKRVETPSKLQRHMSVHDKKSRLVSKSNII
jgi:DNA-directed RNA polymerase subunit RPC12/RpoP